MSPTIANEPRSAEALLAQYRSLIDDAFSISMTRFRTLANWEFEAFVLLLQEWKKHNHDPVEQSRIERTMREIVSQKPESLLVPIDLGPPPELTGEGKRLATFIGRKLKEVRERSGLTQQKLAEKTGLRQSHISRLEQFEHTPTRITLEKIAKALGIEVRVFDPLED